MRSLSSPPLHIWLHLACNSSIKLLYKNSAKILLVEVLPKWFIGGVLLVTSMEGSVASKVYVSCVATAASAQLAPSIIHNLYPSVTIELKLQSTFRR